MGPHCCIEGGPRTYISDSQRSEERKQHVTLEDTRIDSSIQHKEKERKRKLTALPAKVRLAPLYKFNQSFTFIIINSNADSCVHHFLFTPQPDIKRPCCENNAEKLNEVSPIISTSEQTSSTQQNNDQQTVESNEDYGVPGSPIKSEVWYHL